ncbi:MAG: hypothetical protein RL885_03025 [Planctomycetota bacterium]
MMQVERLEEAGRDLILESTGVTLRLLGGGEIEGIARIPSRRPLWRLAGLPGPRSHWRIERTEPTVHLRRDGGLSAEWTEDGVLRLEGAAGARLSLDEGFRPRSVASARGRFTILDARGGVTVHPEADSAAGRAIWRAEAVFELGAGRTWIGTLPPRWPTLEHLDWSIAHEGRPHPFPDGAYPGESVIEEAAAHCQVFALHAYFWKAAPKDLRPRLGRYMWRRCSWLTPRHEPDDPDRFARLIEAVKRHGMKLVVYLSPYHCHAPSLEDEVHRVLDEYPVDGLYLDGVADSLPETYRIVRQIRAALGPDRLMYLNATDQPFGSATVICPYIDAWSDFVLRGDSGRGGWRRDRFLDFAVRGFGRSNAVSVWCHYGSWGGPIPWDRVPPQSDIEAALSHHVRLWRRSFWRGRAAKAAFDSVYFEELAECAARERREIEAKSAVAEH